MTRLASWLPPIAWMAAILWLSSGQWSAEHTGGVLIPLLGWLLPWATPAELAFLHGLARKLGHLTEYAILAGLWWRALARETRLPPGARAVVTLAVSVVWASVDEIHQSTVSTRTGSPIDVGLDAAGALAALAVLGSDWRRWVDLATTTLLGTAAVGGAIVLAVNWFAGVASGPLWITAPAAVTALVLLRRRRRRH